MTDTIIKDGSKHRAVGIREEDDGWYVNTVEIDNEGWRKYADPNAKRRDVVQLLRKEYDTRY